MRINWDDTKSEKLKRERGFSFDEVSKMFLGLYYEEMASDDPAQQYAIGFVQTSLLTLVFEYREDDLGEFIWLVTYWKATKTEAALYEKNRK